MLLLFLDKLHKPNENALSILFFWELNLLRVVFGSVDSMLSLLYFSLYHLSNSSKSFKSCNSFTRMLLSYFLGLPTGRAVSSFFQRFKQITSSSNMGRSFFTQNVSIEVCFRFILAVYFRLKNCDTLACNMINYQNFKAF